MLGLSIHDIVLYTSFSAHSRAAQHFSLRSSLSLVLRLRVRPFGHDVSGRMVNPPSSLCTDRGWTCDLVRFTGDRRRTLLVGAIVLLLVGTIAAAAVKSRDTAAAAPASKTGTPPGDGQASQEWGRAGDGAHRRPGYRSAGGWPGRQLLGRNLRSRFSIPSGTTVSRRVASRR